MKVRRILVGVDGSVGSDRALRRSIELAREPGAQIAPEKEELPWPQRC
jgi:nucleotide-binding universal stress UspA family protein